MFATEIDLQSVERKEEKYEILFNNLKALIDENDDPVSSLANTVALLHRNMHWWWTGFYLVKNNELYLGPFHGDVACTKISFGKGVCGSAWKTKTTIIVENVELFPGHIACSAASKSEIVVPINKNGEIVGVLDVDSEHLNFFDETDKQGLEKIVKLLEERVF